MADLRGSTRNTRKAIQIFWLEIANDQFYVRWRSIDLENVCRGRWIALSIEYMYF